MINAKLYIMSTNFAKCFSVHLQVRPYLFYVKNFIIFVVIRLMDSKHWKVVMDVYNDT